MLNKRCYKIRAQDICHYRLSCASDSYISKKIITIATRESVRDEVGIEKAAAARRRCGARPGRARVRMRAGGEGRGTASRLLHSAAARRPHRSRRPQPPASRDRTRASQAFRTTHATCTRDARPPRRHPPYSCAGYNRALRNFPIRAY